MSPMQMMSMLQGANMPQGGMPQMPNMAPQIPTGNAQQKQGIMPGQMPQAPQQQPGFFQNMMSSPAQMAQGMNVMGQMGHGVSGLFSGLTGPSGGTSPMGASNPFTDASGASQAMNTASFLNPAGQQMQMPQSSMFSGFNPMNWFK
ncbi:MAG: hypothetical protein KGL39_24375 [Patescibacteria group bacterium]|nr:hypothetical protein [Patescibacteria group bacterium]